MSRVVFLLGAGASRPAGMPSTDEITERVLSGRDVLCYRRLDALGRLGPYDYRYAVRTHPSLPVPGGWLPNPWRSSVKPVISYLADLHRAVSACRKRTGRRPNYEDIYYLAAQVAYREEQPNPLIGEASGAVIHQARRREMRRRGLPLDSPVRDGEVEHLVGRLLPLLAVFYLEGVVRSLLSRRPANTTYLAALIGGACADCGPQNVDIATLNHDRVIDVFLAKHGICFADGFARRPVQGFRQFLPATYSHPTTRGRVRVLKLHGGVDWVTRARVVGEETGNLGIEVPEIGIAESPSALAEDYVAADLPIQIGTYNKIANYTLYRHLSDLQYQFLHWLDRADRVVVAGYGFGDAGINARLSYWVRQRGERCHLVVADPNLNATKHGWTMGMRSNWAEREGHRVLRRIEAGIESITWDEVRRLCGV